MNWDPVRDIEEFHIKYEQAYEGLPRALPSDTQEFRFKFLREELKEYRYHILSMDQDGVNKQALADALDGLVDLVYVALGTAHLHGFDFREAWNRVHAANMSKVLAKSADESTRGYALDVVKPPGFKPPNHLDLMDKPQLLGYEG